MNIMYDMTQLVIVIPVLNETVATLTEHIMQHVLLKFGICHLVILDDGSLLKVFFTAMFKALNINYDILAKRNHKGLRIEKSYRFINEDITIVAEGRGTNDVFVTVGVETGYAWNSSHNDGTGILRSVPTIGRELRFPLDIDLSVLPPTVSNNSESVVSYSCITASNRYFAPIVLKILVENRRTGHAERINTDGNSVTMHPGDLVMARTTVKSDKFNDKVATFLPNYSWHRSWWLYCSEIKQAR